MRVRELWSSGVLLLVLGATGCGGATSPTQPTAGPGGSEGLKATINLTVDGLGSVEAVTGLSEVTLDALQSTGRDLAYRLDFGDGTAAATGSVAKHVYERPGTFTVTVTVTSRGQTATASRAIIVASPLGAWLQRGFVGRPQRVLVRRLTLNSQVGRTLRGALGAPGQPDRPVTATLSGERSIRVATDDQTEVFEGALPSVISGNKGSLELVARSGPADGDRVVFAPSTAEGPTGPAPDAVFKMRFFSFSAPFGIRGYSPMVFDGSTSRGDELSYFITFGDGQVSTEASPVHRVDREGTYTATLTVVDPFGRSDEESQTFSVRSLVASGYYVEWTGYAPAAPYGSLIIYLNFLAQDGDGVGGRIRFQEYRPNDYVTTSYDFTGTLSGDDQVRLSLNGTDIVLAGTMQLRDYPSGGRMVLTQTGGARNGQVYEFYFRNGY